MSVSYLCWADPLRSLCTCWTQLCFCATKMRRGLTDVCSPAAGPCRLRSTQKSETPDVSLAGSEWRRSSRNEEKSPVKRLFSAAARSFFTHGFTPTSRGNLRWSEAICEYLQRRLLPVTSTPLKIATTGFSVNERRFLSFFSSPAVCRQEPVLSAATAAACYESWRRRRQRRKHFLQKKKNGGRINLFVLQSTHSGVFLRSAELFQSAHTCLTPGVKMTSPGGEHHRRRHDPKNPHSCQRWNWADSWPNYGFKVRVQNLGSFMEEVGRQRGRTGKSLGTAVRIPTVMTSVKIMLTAHEHFARTFTEVTHWLKLWKQ